MSKVFKISEPDTTQIPVVIFEVKGYGTLIMERRLWTKKGGNENQILKEIGVDPKNLERIIYGETRTRDYLNELAGFTGNK